MTTNSSSANSFGCVPAIASSLIQPPRICLSKLASPSF
jgi:hypothetical protein